MLLPVLKTGEKASVLKEAEAPDNVVAANAKASKSFMTGLLVGRAGGVRIYKVLHNWVSPDIEGKVFREVGIPD